MISLILIMRWIFSVSSIIGAVFCIFKKPAVWYIWLVGNTGWVIITLICKDYAQTVMWLAYIVVCIVGIMQWRKDKNKRINKFGVKNEC